MKIIKAFILIIFSFLVSFWGSTNVHENNSAGQKHSSAQDRLVWLRT